MDDSNKEKARRAERERRIAEKMMRMPVNDVVLEVQKGSININDLFAKIEERIKETSNG
jgi:hypothetical protein